MTQQLHEPSQITLSTQAFIILCRLFDGCYDDLKKQESMETLVESIANSLLSGVTYLKEQNSPPKEMTVLFTIDQVFFLRKLLTEMLTQFPSESSQEKTRRWLEECLLALEQAGMRY